MLRRLVTDNDCLGFLDYFDQRKLNREGDIYATFSDLLVSSQCSLQIRSCDDSVIAVLRYNLVHLHGPGYGVLTIELVRGFSHSPLSIQQFSHDVGYLP
jgi:hypothetical protein